MLGNPLGIPLRPAAAALSISFTHDFGLILLAIFDLFVIGLIWREWRRMKLAA